MKKIFKFIVLLLCLTIFIGCKTSQNITNYGSSLRTELIGQQITKSEKHSFKRSEFNNYCITKGISSNLNDWLPASYKDYETKTSIQEFIILEDKDLSDGIASDVYRTKINISGRDTTFVVIYRQTIKK